MSREIVITGAGAVTPLAGSLAGTREAVARGDCALRDPSIFDASAFAERRAGEVRDFDPRPHCTATKPLKLMDRPARFAVAAAAMALADARWPQNGNTSASLGVLTGTSGHDLLIDQLASAMAPDPSARSVHDIPYFADRLLAGLTPLWLITVIPNMISSHVAIQFGAAGPNSTIMSDAAAGIQAIGEASAWIAAGEADAVLAGGADSGVTPLVYAALEQAGRLGDQDAIVPAEGAAMFLVESREHALARGARVVAEIVGYETAAGDRGELDAIAARLTGRCAAGRDGALTVGDSGCTGTRARTIRDRIGHALAAAAPIDLAVEIHGARGLVVALASGFSGVAAGLALRAGRTLGD